MATYKVLGIMSGTSLDGVDIAFCEFSEKNKKWSYTILYSQTFAYHPNWKLRLQSLPEKSGFDLIKMHKEYGHYLGKLIQNFITKHRLKVDFISSHGHTVFHYPNQGINFQVGDGAAIAAECNLPVIYDFRSLDIALKGQGAPLVPIGDKLLFPEYDYCLNLGGFANISFDKKGKRIAFDICPVNIIINELCQTIGKSFDDGGNIAKKGKVIQSLVDDLNTLGFYHRKKDAPKSLGKEWLDDFFYPVLTKHQYSIEDTLRSIYEHIAIQIANVIAKTKQPKKILVTGGGSYNTFLLNCIKLLTNHQIIVPDKNLVEFKEALIFAFLGVLRTRGENNTLKSVTGASRNSIGGSIYFS